MLLTFSSLFTVLAAYLKQASTSVGLNKPCGSLEAKDSSFKTLEPC